MNILNQLTRSFLCLIFVITINTFAKAQNYSIANWPQDKKAAVALTFDDGTKEHFTVVVPELNTRGIKGTFFVSCDLIKDPTIMENAIKSGHEIGDHTKSHPNLTLLDSMAAENEINSCKTEIESRLKNKTNSFAYPLSKYNSTIINIVKRNHLGARSEGPINYNYNFAQTEDDYYKINATLMGKWISVNDFTNSLNKVTNGGGLLTFIYHSIEPDSSFSPISQDIFKQQLDSLTSRKNIWTTTFSDAIIYHRQKNTAIIQEVSNNKDSLVLSLTDNLSNEIFQKPLTLKILIPSGTLFISAKQNGKDLPITNSNGVAIFDAIPDGGNIILLKDIDINATSIFAATTINNEIIKDIFPNPAENIIHIELNSSKLSGAALYEVSDIYGKMVKSSGSNNNFSENHHLKVDISDLDNGIYFFSIIANNQKSVRKIIKAK